MRFLDVSHIQLKTGTHLVAEKSRLVAREGIEIRTRLVPDGTARIELLRYLDIAVDRDAIESDRTFAFITNTPADGHVLQEAVLADSGKLVARGEIETPFTYLRTRGTLGRAFDSKRRDDTRVDEVARSARGGIRQGARVSGVEPFCSRARINDGFPKRPCAA